MSETGLLEVGQRLLADKDFRERFLINPGETLADLGLSQEAYGALVAMAPALLAGGAMLLKSTVLGGQVVPEQGWGRP